MATQPSDLRWPAVMELGPPEPGEVQLWCSLLREEAARPASYEKALAPDEVQRALRFRSETLRERFVVSRAVLRRILGNCLDVAPDQVRFVTDARGKPRLAPPCGLEFNLAHTADLMLLAVTRGWPVGVDVERIRRLQDSRAIAHRFFTKREADWLQDRPDELLDRAFFELWTRKEAFLKAVGEGISSGLASLELLKSDGRFKNRVTGGAKGSSKGTWTVCELEPAAGFVGALALPARAGAITLRKATVRPA